MTVPEISEDTPLALPSVTKPPTTDLNKAFVEVPRDPEWWKSEDVAIELETVVSNLKSCGSDI